MPPNHQHQVKFNGFDGRRYSDWAQKIGENTTAVIDRLLKQQAVEEQAYRSCMGILQMSQTYGNERLEAACAMPTMVCFYRDVLGFEIMEEVDASNIYLVKDGTLFLLYRRTDFEQMAKRSFSYANGIHGPPSTAVKAAGTDISRQKKKHPLLLPPTSVMKCGTSRM